MKRTLKILAAVFVFIMLLSAASCASSGSETQVTTNGPEANATESGSEAVTEPVSTEINALNVLGPNDFKNEKVVFYSSSYNGVWSTDLFYENNDGDILGSAIFRRNSTVSETYKVDLSEIKSGKKSFNAELSAAVKAEDDGFNLVYLGLADAASASVTGILHDLNRVENLNLDGQWWNQPTRKSWSIANRLYYATGDITTIDNMAIRMMYFNKSIVTDKKLDSPYKLVDENGWVYEKFFEMVEAAASDATGNGVSIEDDVFGVVAQKTFGFMMTMGSGEMLVSKDDDDLPVPIMNGDTSRLVDVAEFLTDKISGHNSVYLGADADIMNIFSSGRSLFMAEVLQHAKTMRQNYDINFGLLPMPKYNSDQKDYHQYCTGYCTTVVGIPTNAKGEVLDRASFILEAMAVESVNTVTPAYYEICLKGRYSDDKESSEMIDIICSSVSSDLAEIFGWSGFKSSVESTISGGGSITRILDGMKRSVPKEIERTVNSILELP